MRVKQLEVLGGKLGQHLSFGGFALGKAEVRNLNRIKVTSGYFSWLSLLSHFTGFLPRKKYLAHLSFRFERVGTAMLNRRFAQPLSE